MKSYETFETLVERQNATLNSKLPRKSEFRVRVETIISNFKDLKKDVPQGSIRSVTLFDIKKNIVKNIYPGIESSLYMDDFLICCRSKHMHHTEHKLQLFLNKISKWTEEGGSKFSQDKTKYMHFCDLRRIHHDPCLNRKEIQKIDRYKFLDIKYN